MVKDLFFQNQGVFLGGLIIVGPARNFQKPMPAIKAPCFNIAGPYFQENAPTFCIMVLCIMALWI